MSDVVLVADGGEITVGRRVAGFVWGKWVTQVLDGEQPKADDPRLVQGFVHKPTNMPQGRFDIRGVRADITQVMAVAPDGGIDYDRGSSDAEQVLDAAETRSDGEVFFESDITVIGLGPHVPGLDFDIDSIVDVQLCQRRIAAPVTAVDMTAENGVLGWRVHTGGQPIVDSVRLNSSNTQILGVLAQERRESDARLAAVDSKADGAVSDARAAQSTATQADENAKNAQGSADQAQETADEAIKKWREQKDALDKVQSAQIETNAKVNDAQQRAIDLGFLFNHGEWVMSKEWKANAGESKVMDFDTASSTPRGCESTVITTDGKPVGSGIKFLSPGYWRLYARVLIPWVGLIQSAEVNVSIVVMGKNGKRIAKARYDLVVDAAPGTASFPTTVEIPESGCYAYVEVRTNRALNQSIVPGTFVEPGNNEFSAQQISKIF